MLKSKYLTKKQKGVLEDLFSGSLTVQEVLEKWYVTRRTYFRWHAQEFFAAEFKRLMNLVHSESDLICARYSAQVAMKLVSLTVAEKDEIARKACMNVINHPSRKTKNQIVAKNLLHLSTRIFHFICKEFAYNIDVWWFVIRRDPRISPRRPTGL